MSCPECSPSLSIILPVLNEAPGLASILDSLSRFRGRGAEVIVVDGGSSDGSAEIAARYADRVLVVTPRGRARQMNAGAAAARGCVLLFLHADTRLPEMADHQITQAIGLGPNWGRFDVQIEGKSVWLPLVATMMNWRSRLTGIATGDQAMFARKETFEMAGRFAEIPLMEDIDLSRRLLRIERPACLKSKVTTSGRRWETNGILSTILLMWSLRLRYFFGADPNLLALEYGYARDK